MRVKFFITTPELFKDLLEWKLIAPGGGERLLFSASIPGFGSVAFTRYWSCRFASDQDTFSGSAGTYASLVIEDFDATQTGEYVARFKDALLVISLLCRQQIQLVGWDIADEQVRIDPMKPLIPTYVPPEPGNFMIWPDTSKLVVVAEDALRNFFEMDFQTRRAVKLMIVGIAPFVEMSDSQQFMAIMHGFEWLPMPEVETAQQPSENDKLLVNALDAAKIGRCDEVVERIQGLINIVTKKQKNFSSKMRRIPTEKNILVGDLWPLHRSGGTLGLVDIRDKLAHGGPSSLHHFGLAIARWHLGIFAERTVLVLLQIDLNLTRLTPKELAREYWYKRDIWPSERARIQSGL